MFPQHRRRQNKSTICHDDDVYTINIVILFWCFQRNLELFACLCDLSRWMAHDTSFWTVKCPWYFFVLDIGQKKCHMPSIVYSKVTIFETKLYLFIRMWCCFNNKNKFTIAMRCLLQGDDRLRWQKRWTVTTCTCFDIGVVDCFPIVPFKTSLHIITVRLK